MPKVTLKVGEVEVTLVPKKRPYPLDLTTIVEVKVGERVIEGAYTSYSKEEIEEWGYKNTLTLELEIGEVEEEFYTPLEEAIEAYLGERGEEGWPTL